VLNGHSYIVTSLDFNPSTGELASSSADGTVRLWDPAKGGTESRIIDQQTSRATICRFSPDGLQLAWGYETGEIKMSYLKSLFALPVILQSSGAPVYSMAFSHTEGFFSTGDEAGTIRIWAKEKDYKSPVLLVGHISRISGIQFSPDDTILGSSSFDGTVRLWNFREPDETPIVIDDYDFWVTCMALSPDGAFLYSGSADKTIKVKQINMELLAAKICGGVSRNMTQEEWNKYVGMDIEYEKTCSNLP
jgi:WD40 repeat protein